MSQVRQALRQILVRPGMALVVIVMLALGIGSTTAIFSVFHQILIRPLPVPAPERLVNVVHMRFQQISYPLFRDLEAEQMGFSGLAAYNDFDVNLAFDLKVASGRGALVSGSYFDVLGIRPALGRLIGPSDEPQAGESPVVVLSHDYWTRDFGSDPGVIGQPLTVNARAFTIVGVAPDGFSGAVMGEHPEVFVPLTMAETIAGPGTSLQDRFRVWLYAFARLEPAISLEQASTSIDAVYARIAETEAPLNPFMSSEEYRQLRISLEPGGRGRQSGIRSDATRSVTLLFGITILVLLIVCLNVANLLLARGATRVGEMAIRTSIGASRAQLMMQLFSEALSLAIIGGIVSLPVAVMTLRTISVFLPVDLVEGLAIRLSPEAMAFAVLATLFTVLLFGVYPAARSARINPIIAMRGQATNTSGERGVLRLRTALATAQISFSLALLVLAGFFTQSLINIARVDFGLDVDSVISFRISPGLNRYSAEEMDILYGQIKDEFNAQPGITGIATAMLPLLTDNGLSVSITGFDDVALAETDASVNMVDPGLFDTLAIPLIAGRDFGDTDRADSPRVAIVNEAFARQFRLGNSVIGERFNLMGGTEIVGLVADAAYSSVKEGDPPPQLYLPRRQSPFGALPTLNFYLRTGIQADVLLPMIPRVVARVDPNLPVTNVLTMKTQIQNNVYLDRLVTVLSASLAGLATLLAAIGLYGVLSYSVTQRTREFGLRLALGAPPERLRRLVLYQVAWMVLVGLPVGLIAGYMLGRSAAALLFGLSRYDPTAILVAITVLGGVMSLAAYLPARRVSHIAPMEALRYE